MPASKSGLRWLLWIGVVYGLQAGCVGGGGHARDGGAGHGGTAGGSAGVGGIGGGGGFPLDASVGFDGGGNPCAFCPGPPSGVASGFLFPCCTIVGGCGLSSNGIIFQGCLDLRDPGFSDPGCPSETAALLGMPVEGCCTRRGACGVSLSSAGLGCIERRELVGSPLIQLTGPTDIVCGRFPVDAGGLSDSAVDEDAGETPCDWDANGACDPSASCIVREGIARCQCGAGYVDLSPSGLSGITCRDINECLVSGACAEGVCVNTPGAFRCEPTSE